MKQTKGVFAQNASEININCRRCKLSMGKTNSGTVDQVGEITRLCSIYDNCDEVFFSPCTVMNLNLNLPVSICTLVRPISRCRLNAHIMLLMAHADDAVVSTEISSVVVILTTVFISAREYILLKSVKSAESQFTWGFLLHFFESILRKSR